MSKTITVSDELYQALLELKGLFSQIVWEEIKTEEEVIWMLVTWFIESIENFEEENNDKSSIITDPSQA